MEAEQALISPELASTQGLEHDDPFATHAPPRRREQPARRPGGR
jgi:hypothetical protein